jgi:hypothetical protein
MSLDAVAEVVNGKGGKTPYVIETFDVAAFDASIPPMALVERHRPGAFDLPDKAIFLQAPQPVA